MSSIEELNQLQIPLQEILFATNDFSSENRIGLGGFGNVYRGESIKRGTMAIKRWDCHHGESRHGDHEFRTEIRLLSIYKHENIASLRGFCDEDGEKILVYKYESNGSLDKHLKNKDLGWTQRLRICLDAARGLTYLHDGVGLKDNILHRDVKSANILLDENWKAKISDFGLSRNGPARSSFVISNCCGTPGYIDPEYFVTGHLTQKSDVFSFGVVLFEVLCGRQAFSKVDGQFFNVWVQKHFKRQTLDKIILSDLHEINPDSLNVFSTIAYQCLRNGEERPTMKKVVEQLQKALDHQLISSGPWSDVYDDFMDDDVTLHQRQTALMQVQSNDKEAAAAIEETGTSAPTVLIGTETRMQDLRSLLEIGSGGVRMVGVSGGWGSGKSTLASSIYDEINNEFEGCCFVKNVRAESRKHGLKTLQEKILSDVLKSKVTVRSIEQGTSMMRRRLCQKKILVVLDDVNHNDHLQMLAESPDWFGDGSRIIITTRNQDLVNAHNFITHNVRMLDAEEAIELFSWHAFGTSRPLEGCDELSRSVVSKLGGHPLALKSLGTFLHDKDMIEWQSTLARLEGIPVDEVLEKLNTGDDGVSRNVFSWFAT